MLRARYESGDFDFAVIHLEEGQVFYVMPAEIFNSYGSTIGLVESPKRQRKPRSAEYRERWDLVSTWATQPATAEFTPVKVGEPFTGNPEPKLVPVGAGEV